MESTFEIWENFSIFDLIDSLGDNADCLSEKKNLQMKEYIVKAQRE